MNKVTMDKFFKSAITAVAFLYGSPSLALAQPAANPGSLSPVDYAFVGQTYLGNKFQVDTGKLGMQRATGAKVKDYAKEMVPSHEMVEQKLVGILQKKNVTQPPESLLEGSYAELVASLQKSHASSFDREYVSQQLGYQTSNDALYRWELANGTDPDLKAFAKEVLVKIDQHFDMVKDLAKAEK